MDTNSTLSLARRFCLLPVLLALALSGFAVPQGLAQSVPEPNREQLLNGLRVVLWQRPGDANVILKLRIHSGAIFDMAGKSGTMALLGDALFPDPATREYVTEELGGRLVVTTDTDAINVTLSGRASEFERLVELLRAALINTQLTPESVTKLRDARAKLLRQESIAPAIIADRAISARLFGDYPLGRSFSGTPASLARIERSDLLFARERFLNPNNATLVVVGSIDRARVMRVLRQRLGPWRQSEQIVPPTFRQPDAPDARTLIIDLPGTETAEIRLAARSVARADRDYAAAMLLALLARDKWQATFPQLATSPFFVRNEAHVLPGIFLMGASVNAPLAANALTAARNVLAALAAAQPSASELERVRAEALAKLNKEFSQPDTIADLWLDMDTYKLYANFDQSKLLRAVTPTDVQRVAAGLFRDAPIASIAVGSSTQLQADFERGGRVEVLGASEKLVQPKTIPAKKQ